MKARVILMSAAALALPFLATGCGGSDDTNSGSRPTAKEISAAVTKQVPTAPAGVADCVGKKLESSELPNGVLRSFVSGEQKTSSDADNEEKYTKIITDATTDCTTAALTGN